MFDTTLTLLDMSTFKKFFEDLELKMDSSSDKKEDSGSQLLDIMRFDHKQKGHICSSSHSPGGLPCPCRLRTSRHSSSSDATLPSPSSHRSHEESFSPPPTHDSAFDRFKDFVRRLIELLRCCCPCLRRKHPASPSYDRQQSNGHTTQELEATATLDRYVAGDGDAAVIDDELLQALSTLIYSDDGSYVKHAASTIHELSYNLTHEITSRILEPIELLIGMRRVDVLQHTTGALLNLVTGDHYVHNCGVVVESHVIPDRLVYLMKHGRTVILENVCGIIAQLVHHAEYQQMVMETDAPEYLVQLASSDNSSIRLSCCLAISCLSYEKSYVDKFVKLGMIPVLEKNLSSVGEDNKVLVSCLKTLANVCVSKNHLKLCSHAAGSQLVRIVSVHTTNENHKVQLQAVLALRNLSFDKSNQEDFRSCGPTALHEMASKEALSEAMRSALLCLMRNLSLCEDNAVWLASTQFLGHMYYAVQASVISEEAQRYIATIVNNICKANYVLLEAKADCVEAMIALMMRPKTDPEAQKNAVSALLLLAQGENVQSKLMADGERVVRRLLQLSGATDDDGLKLRCAGIIAQLVRYEFREGFIEKLVPELVSLIGQVIRLDDTGLEVCCYAIDVLIDNAVFQKTFFGTDILEYLVEKDIEPRRCKRTNSVDTMLHALQMKLTNMERETRPSPTRSGLLP